SRLCVCSRTWLLPCTNCTTCCCHVGASDNVLARRTMAAGLSAQICTSRTVSAPSVSGGPGRREGLRSNRDAHLICSTTPLEHRTARGVARVAGGHTEPERGKQCAFAARAAR